MNDDDNKYNSRPWRLAIGAYLLIAFGSYFLTFVITRVARIKDLLGL